MLSRLPFRSALSIALLAPILSFTPPLRAQETTQFVVTAESKAPVSLTPDTISVEMNGKKAQVISVTPLAPEATQIAFLIDDGLRSSLGRQLSDINDFINGLQSGVEIMVGYMQNGRVVTAQPFTANHAAAAGALRLPFSSPGLSASPYICLSDFVSHWPSESESYGSPRTEHVAKKRFVMMLTNGVDPYNGSVSPLNQDSPYVQRAASDAQQANAAVFSIYYSDAGIRGGLANLSGQSYLNQIASATGGISYYQMNGSPVSLSPYLKQFQASISQSFMVSLTAPDTRDRVSLRVKSQTKGVKLHAPASFNPASGATAGPRG